MQSCYFFCQTPMYPPCYAKHSEPYFWGLKFNILTLASMNFRLNVRRVARPSRRVTNVIAARVRNVSSVLGTSKDFLPKSRLNKNVSEIDQRNSCACQKRVLSFGHIQRFPS